MGTPAERDALIQSITIDINNLADVDADSLGRSAELSPDINFEETVPYFGEMLSCVRELGQRDLSHLPAPTLQDIANACKQLEKCVTRVREFVIAQDPVGECNQIKSEIFKSHEVVVGKLLLPLAFTATQTADYERLYRDAEGYIGTIKAEVEQFAAHMESVRRQARDALDSVLDQAALAGASSNALIFRTNADQHRDSATTWYKLTWVFLVMTFLAALGAVWMAIGSPPPPTTGSAIQLVFAKLVVLSTLSFGLFWASRNYKAQKHNETLNRHRANALSTFRTFVEGTADPAIKDAILLQASQAAFAGRPTGYDAPDKDSPTVNPIVPMFGGRSPFNVPVDGH